MWNVNGNYYMRNIKILLVFAVALVCACQNRYVENWTEMRTDYNEFVFPADIDKSSFNIYYSGDWTLEVDGKGWLSADKVSGRGVTNIILNFSANKGLSRAASIKIKTVSEEKLIPVTQKAGVSNPKIEFASLTNLYPRGSYDLRLEFDTNIPWEYLKDAEISAKDVDSGQNVDWFTDIVVSPEEMPIPPDRKEEFPTGVRRCVSARIQGNDGLDVRSLKFSIFLVDAGGVSYTDTMLVSQSTEPAFLKIQEKDIVNKLGGERSIPFTTNLDALISGIECEISYPDKDVTDFVSNVSIDGKYLKYTLSENDTKAYRYASAILSYTDLNGEKTVTEPSLNIEQNIFSGSFDDVEFTSADELLAWNASYNLWKDTDKIRLGADIDMNGQTLVCHEFAGSFDGQGHKVYNFKIDGDGNLGFFGSLVRTASVSNLVLGSSDGMQYDGQTSISIPAKGNTNAGGLAGLIVGNAKVSNIHNFIAISAKDIESGNINLGGIVGVVESCDQFTGCSNSGSISVVGGTVGNLYAGGISGDNKGSSAIFNECVNSASISSSATTSATYIGGILGNVSVASELKKCSNKGNIMVTGKCTETFSSPTSAGSCRVAGLAGSCAAAVKISNGENSGRIEVNSNTSYANISGMVAVNTNGQATLSLCVNNGYIGGAPVSNGANQVVRIAGLVALSTVSGTTMNSCENYGELKLDNDYQIWRCWIGGAAGYCKAVVVSGGKFKANLSRGNISAGQISTVIGQDDTTGGRVENNGVAGTLNGTVIAEGNFNNPISNIVAKKTGAYSPDLATAGNYFLND